MFEPIVQAAWELHAPKTALNGPSREAMRQLVTLSIDPYTGDPAPAGSGRALTEYFKRDPSGRIDDTQFRIVSRAESYAYRGGYDEDDGPFQQRSYDNRLYGDNRPPFPFPTWRLGPREYPSWAEVRDTLNKSLLGWSNYFSYGTRRSVFRGVDRYVYERVRDFLARRSWRGYPDDEDRLPRPPLRVDPDYFWRRPN